MRPRSLVAAVLLAASPALATPPGAFPKALTCAVKAPTAAAASHGDPRARKAAQRGLEYLARASISWTNEKKCFGCHVQAVTMEALSVGKHHQYEIAKSDIEAMVNALSMGVTAGGHTTGVAFEGQAWARYDQWVSAQHTKDLLKYAEELLRLQQQDGAIPDDDARLPVTGGVMHTTYQAMQTWRQAFARTADQKWLAPIRKSEKYLAKQSVDWSTKSDVYIQNVNFALLGLVAAGVGPSEESSQRLQKILLARQNQDGGWGLEKNKSDALATGQTLYSLKLAGHGDGDPRIAKGTRWLVDHQQKDGAWRTVKSGQNGAEKGEGMWAVLGLVSVDVMSLSVKGLVDGQHVSDTMQIDVEAKDNQGGGVSKVELYVDDLPVAGDCAAKIGHKWSTAGLATGKHIVDVVAENVKGQVSRRRYEVYAGDVYLVDVGTRFDERAQQTEIALRNISPAPESNRVELAVYTVNGAGNDRGKKIWSTDQKGAAGPMSFRFANGENGKPHPRGRYLAELTVRDAKGKAIQTETALFFHDSEDVERKQFGEIEGQLSMRGGAGLSANTEVELVDEKGNVVQRVRSTEQGNYRFKGVSAGNYKVRASKRGFAAQESSVRAAPAAAPAKADMTF